MNEKQADTFCRSVPLHHQGPYLHSKLNESRAGSVAGGWWLVAGGWWLVAGGWWLVAKIIIVNLFSINGAYKLERKIENANATESVADAACPARAGNHRAMEHTWSIVAGAMRVLTTDLQNAVFTKAA